MTDQFRELCAELVAIENALSSGMAIASNQGQALDGYSALANFRSVANRARTALAQQEPDGPTNEELDELAWNWFSKTGSTWYQTNAHRAFARAALARWGCSAPPPADGEVAELAKWLRAWAGFSVRPRESMKFLRAADLVERHQPEPVPTDA